MRLAMRITQTLRRAAANVQEGMLGYSDSNKDELETLAALTFEATLC